MRGWCRDRHVPPKLQCCPIINEWPLLMLKGLGAKLTSALICCCHIPSLTFFMVCERLLFLWGWGGGMLLTYSLKGMMSPVRLMQGSAVFTCRYFPHAATCTATSGSLSLLFCFPWWRFVIVLVIIVAFVYSEWVFRKCKQWHTSSSTQKPLYGQPDRAHSYLTSKKKKKSSTLHSFLPSLVKTVCKKKRRRHFKGPVLLTVSKAQKGFLLACSRLLISTAPH